MPRTRKPVLAALLAVSALILTAGCAGGRHDTVELRLGHVNSVTDPWQTSSEEFARLVHEGSGGTVEVQVFPSAQLGGDRDMVEGMQIGSVDLALVAGVLSSVEPAMTMLEIPYMFPSQAALNEALDGPGGQQLSAALLEKGIRNLAWLDRGPRELTANRPITDPAELDGAKIRVPEIPASIDAWRAMGANPTPMAFSEVYSALQQGVIDGQENPYAITESANLNDVQRYVMETDHVYGYVMLAMSEDAWERLSPQQRQVVTEAAQAVRRTHNARTAVDEERYKATLAQKGMTFVEVDREAFRQAVQPVHQHYAREFGQELYDMLGTPHAS
ncbi:TRAP transporter substrate-binding protein [Pseudonocardia sp. MH-G8]|uniref:TRAP transporter substrate-binding protein n=1 Tax=Pseudonocardia sp. MH-G8 TaxID=1854588 RepID=UPI000BA17EAC|nr:TRAP transporter substrate-binding protein [Pseudonocardia sp. MH-G8]OZM76937.1 C4-dicarboxylate ABC transporter substrate-binding protein [Pseudonocardia sp. MH-G8]